MLFLKDLKSINIILFALVLFIPDNGFALLGKSETGGMSEILFAETKIKIDGGFIEGYDESDVTVRAKGVEVSLNIDNSNSNEARTFNFTVTNINPDITEIIGLSEGKIGKGKNSLSFPVKVESKKVAVYKLTPKIPADTFKLMVFGESQGGRHVLNRIIGDINYRKPLLAISCGDMLEKPTNSGYKTFLKEIGKVTVPFLTVVGGSEVDKGSRRYYEQYFGSTYYSFDYKNSHFVFLDNGDGLISEEQFLWLENDLIQNKAIHKFVFMHTPPFDPRPARKQPMQTGEQFRRLMSIMEKNKVSRVFSAGIHDYFKEERNGVTYIITGGGGSPLASADASYNYVIVEVEKEKVKDKLIKLTSPPIKWYKAASLKGKLYLKNAFEVHPVRTTFLLIFSIFVAIFLVRSVHRKFLKRTKRRVVF